MCGTTPVKVEMDGTKPNGGNIVLSNGKVTSVTELSFSNGDSYNLENGKLVLSTPKEATESSCFVYATETVEDFDDYDVSKCKVAVAETLVELGAVPQDQIESEGAQSQVNSYCASKESVKGAIQLAGSVLIPKLLEQEALTGVKMKQLTETSIGGYTCNDKDVIIPNTLGGITVTSIGVGAFMQKGLTNVTIPNTVTTIGDGAFSSNRLESVTIGNSVQTIGSGAFNQNQLTSVTIPNSVTTIGDSAFSMNQLESITLGNNVREIGVGEFAINRLESVTIPDSVTTIYGIAFAYNNLKTVTLGNSVAIIGEGAFGRNQLTEVTIPNSVTQLYRVAFGCGSESVTVDEEEITYGPNVIEKVTIVGKSPAELERYDGEVFCWVSGKSDANINE